VKVNRSVYLHQRQERLTTSLNSRKSDDRNRQTIGSVVEDRSLCREVLGLAVF